MTETRTSRTALCWISACLLVMASLVVAPSANAAERETDAKPVTAKQGAATPPTVSSPVDVMKFQSSAISVPSPADAKAAPATAMAGAPLQVRGAFGSGGGQSSGGSLNVGGVFGQVVAGKIGSSTVVHQGFWFGFGQASCCLGKRGNLRNEPGDFVDIADLQAMIDLLFFGGDPGVCPEESNVDGLGDIDITDLQLLVGYLFLGEQLVDCP